MRQLATVVAAAALLLTPWAALAESEDGLAPWNQERVTEYAKELQTACNDLNTEMNKAAPPTLGQQRANFYNTKETIRLLQRASRGLAATLENGAGREETWPRFRRIRTLRNDAVEYGTRAQIPDYVLEKATPVGNAIMKLRPYYTTTESPRPRGVTEEEPAGEDVM